MHRCFVQKYAIWSTPHGGELKSDKMRHKKNTMEEIFIKRQKMADKVSIHTPAPRLPFFKACSHLLSLPLLKKESREDVKKAGATFCNSINPGHDKRKKKKKTINIYSEPVSGGPVISVHRSLPVTTHKSCFVSIS